MSTNERIAELVDQWAWRCGPDEWANDVLPRLASKIREMDSEEVTVEEMHEAAVKAVKYVGITSTYYKEQAAKQWLDLIFSGNRNLSIHQVQEIEDRNANHESAS